MHTEHDLDLVIALADGSLTDPHPAEDLVATCPECADTYEAYLAVRAAVAASPVATMTDLERRRLHNSLWAEIADEKAPAASPAPAAAPRTPWWYRVAPVAAALAVVVGVGATLTGGDDVAATFDTVAAEMGRDGVEDETGGGEFGDEESMTDMLAAPEETTAADGSTDTAVTFSRQMPLVITTAELEEAVAAFEDQVESGYQPDADTQTCVGTELDSEAVVATESVTLDGAPVLFVALGSRTDVSAVIVLHQSDCTFLFDPR